MTVTVLGADTFRLHFKPLVQSHRQQRKLIPNGALMCDCSCIFYLYNYTAEVVTEGDFRSQSSLP